MTNGDVLGAIEFLSTPSARRATRRDRHGRHGIMISIHALREEGDKTSGSGMAQAIQFLSTPSARRATIHKLLVPVDLKFLSTPSARRATADHREAVQEAQISIHALREEGDR